MLHIRGCKIRLNPDISENNLEKKVEKEDGLPGGTRTPDLRLRRPLLYPVELRADKKGPLQGLLRRKWSERKDSNLRPSGPKPDALPDCATLRQACYSNAGRENLQGN